MAQISGFFNSINHDRVYDASNIAQKFEKYFTNGIFNNSLQVVSNDNMTISVEIGDANINGYDYKNTELLTLDISESDAELSRIDSIVIRLDLNNRQITAQVLEGSYATNPSPPSITRTTNIYDLRLANISVPVGATRITTEMITDTRFTSDCGNVVQAVQSIDTEDIFAQYQAEWDSWFASVQDVLDENVAGHLQNEIGTLSDLNTDSKSSLVSATNEVNSKAIDIRESIYGTGTTWSSSKTYSKDDIVTYNYKFYANKTGKNTSTTPDKDATNWEEVSLF